MNIVDPLVNILIHFTGFFIAMFGLSALNFEKAIKSGRVIQAQVLYVGCGMGLGYLISQFLLQLLIP